MKQRPNFHKTKGSEKIRKSVYAIIFFEVIVLLGISLYILPSDSSQTAVPAKIAQTQVIRIERPLPEKKPKPVTVKKPVLKKMPVPVDDGLWDGPILYHSKSTNPIHFILVEKAIQKLHLYRYDGQYHRLNSYPCATGKQLGEKREEKDQKTPEGIFFNTKSFRDTKVTLFGDRAFGLNYPDAFDELRGNRGNGIFIHGSNRDITPYSTNGCIVMNNTSLSELDKQIKFENTPVIIGKRLPYKFAVSDTDRTKLIPLLEKAMLPKQYAGAESEYKNFYLLGFKNRMVAISDIEISGKKSMKGFSRLYLSGQGDNLFVLIKRKWREEPAALLAKAKIQPQRPVVSENTRIKTTLTSWRKAWEGKKIDAYMGHYHHGFIGNGKNITAWKNHKAKLNKRYRTISVNISNIKIRVNDKKASVYFRQRYRSDRFKSTGFKKLELIKIGKIWKIYRERSFPRKPKNWPA